MAEHLEVNITMYGKEYSENASASMRLDVSISQLPFVSIGQMCDGLLRAVVADLNESADKQTQERDADQNNMRIAIHNAMEQLRNNDTDKAFIILQEVE